MRMYLSLQHLGFDKKAFKLRRKRLRPRNCFNITQDKITLKEETKFYKKHKEPISQLRYGAVLLDFYGTVGYWLNSSNENNL